MTQFKSYSIGRTNPLVALLFFFLIMMAIYWVAKGAYALLSIAFPFMIVATAFLNHKVILGYFSWIKNLLKTNVLFGVIAIVLSIFTYPMIGAFLLYRAYRSRGQKGDRAESNEPLRGEYIQYEEVEVEDDFLDLSDVKKQQKEIKNRYEDLL